MPLGGSCCLGLAVALPTSGSAAAGGVGAGGGVGGTFADGPPAPAPPMSPVGAPSDFPAGSVDFVMGASVWSDFVISPPAKPSPSLAGALSPAVGAPARFVPTVSNADPG